MLQITFFDYVSDYFEMVYWIPGNHEYYRSEINERKRSISRANQRQCSFAEQQSIQYQDYKIIFSTLWTSIGDQHANEIKRGMADFRVIKDDGLSLRPKKLQSTSS